MGATMIVAIRARAPPRSMDIRDPSPRPVSSEGEHWQSAKHRGQGSTSVPVAATPGWSAEDRSRRSRAARSDRRCTVVHEGVARRPKASRCGRAWRGLYRAGVGSLEAGLLLVEPRRAQGVLGGLPLSATTLIVTTWITPTFSGIAGAAVLSSAHVGRLSLAAPRAATEHERTAKDEKEAGPRRLVRVSSHTTQPRASRSKCTSAASLLASISAPSAR